MIKKMVAFLLLFLIVLVFVYFCSPAKEFLTRPIGIYSDCNGGDACGVKEVYIWNFWKKGRTYNLGGPPVSF